MGPRPRPPPSKSGYARFAAVNHQAGDPADLNRISWTTANIRGNDVAFERFVQTHAGDPARHPIYVKRATVRPFNNLIDNHRFDFTALRIYNITVTQNANGQWVVTSAVLRP